MSNTDRHSDPGTPIHESFSPAYQKFIENEADFVGMLAYCLYKKQKKNYVESLVNRFDNLTRRSKRIEEFHNEIFNDQHVDDFRDAADHRLTTYVKKFVDEAIGETYEKIANNQNRDPVNKDKNRQSRMTSAWVLGISTSMTATIILGV
ncbi:MAG: hypothetical protein OEU92_23385, partial [Alphaproteobacteria bacterium]|nr:hypothetical protein [Alphaproteobacteria bacterium]